MNKKEFVSIYETQEESLKHDNIKERYIIIGESLSAHCCFSFSIVDTKLGNDGEDWENNICEVFNLKNAIEICYALNQTT